MCGTPAFCAPAPAGASAAALRIAALAALLFLSGCARTVVVTSREVLSDQQAPQQTQLRSAANLPAAFVVVTPATVSTDCPAVLRDPGLNTVLTLYTSVLQPVRDEHGTHYEAVGDYVAEPRGRYGDTEPGDGIRVDCARLRPLGMVRLGRR
jgi:hypothetical protein